MVYGYKRQIGFSFFFQAEDGIQDRSPSRGLGDVYRRQSGTGRIMTFNQDIGSWDTSSVRDMEGLFFGCAFFSHDISAWDTSAVTNMSIALYECDSFNHDLRRWDVSRVINASSFGLATNAPHFSDAQLFYDGEDEEDYYEEDY